MRLDVKPIATARGWIDAHEAQLGGFSLFIAHHVQKHVGADALYFHSAVRLDFIHEGFTVFSSRRSARLLAVLRRHSPR